MSPSMDGTVEADCCRALPDALQEPRVASLSVKATKQGSNHLPLESSGARPKSRNSTSQKKSKSEKNGSRKKEIKTREKYDSLPSNSRDCVEYKDEGLTQNEDKKRKKNKRKDYPLSPESVKTLSSSEDVCVTSSNHICRSISEGDNKGISCHRFPKFKNYNTRRLSFIVFVFPIRQLVEALIDAGFIYSGELNLSLV